MVRRTGPQMRNCASENPEMVRVYTWSFALSHAAERRCSCKHGADAPKSPK
jgi:hypothetical protein